MSSEESYKAIIRYLTNEKKPYAPGTEDNVKRKIRKAAACYVVRRGTLYYQKKRKDRDEFDELEVVLEAGSRRELIASFHQSAEGFHFTRDQTWKSISQSYWWRGIFKQVKDHIRECIQCKEKVDRNRSVSADTMEILEQLGIDAPMLGDSKEIDDDLSNSEGRSSAPPRPTKKNTVPKQELVFVDSKGLVKQESEKHCQVVLEQLNLQRLSNQFCDVTLLIEGEEFKAHKSILAASSEYFRVLFIEKGAVSSHEAVVDLSGFNKTSFLPLLEFAYTSVLAFDFCHMADVATLARHLLMQEVLEICEHVHKQLEERKITVYQNGDVKTVSSQVNTPEVELLMDVDPLEPQELETIRNTGEDSITVLLQGAIQIPVPAETPAEAPPSMMEDETPKEAVTAEAEEALTVEELTVQQSQGTLDCPGEGSDDENSQAHEQTEPVESSGSVPDVESTESNAKDVAETPSADVQVDTPAVNGNENQVTAEPPDPLSSDVTAVPKRKRGRPPKLHDKLKVVAVASSSKCLLDDTYKSRLRQRTLAEGGYIRLHKGTEKKLRARKTNLKSATQQVAQKLVKRGRKMQPKRTIVEGDDVEMEHKCIECGKTFPKRYTLMMHMMTHNRTKEFKCPLCEKEFLYKASLLSHLLRHKRTNEQIDESPGGRTKRQFICDICGKILPKPYNLRLHMLKHTGVQPHVCKLCGKTFGYKHSLRLHMAHHEGKREFSCDVCEKSFATKRSLQEHNSVHTGMNPQLVRLLMQLQIRLLADTSAALKLRADEGVVRRRVRRRGEARGREQERRRRLHATLLTTTNNYPETRVYKQRSTYEELSEEICIRRLRITKVSIGKLCTLLKDSLQTKSYIFTALSVELKVTTALNFFANGSFQAITGDLAHISTNAARMCIHQVIDAIIEHQGTFMHFDLSLPARQLRALEFHKIAGFPKVLGCVDGTHIALRVVKCKAPVNYCNRKGYHSLNVMIVCDAKLRILTVNASHAGGKHDSTVLYNAKVYDALRALPPGSGWLLGDSGYAQKPWLMTPFRNPNSEEKSRYNRAHIATRHVVERAIGVLKSRFRCLDRSGGTLLYTHAVVSKIVLACCCMHNFAISEGMKFEPEVSVMEEECVGGDDTAENDDPLPILLDEPTPAVCRNARAALVNSAFRL